MIYYVNSNSFILQPSNSLSTTLIAIVPSQIPQSDHLSYLRPNKCVAAQGDAATRPVIGLAWRGAPLSVPGCLTKAAGWVCFPPKPPLKHNLNYLNYIVIINVAATATTTHD